jgi:hypothetical protein
MALSGFTPKPSNRNVSTPEAGMPRLADTRVGDDERSAKAELPGDLAGARHPSRAEQHARPRMEIERNHLQ